MRAALNVPLWFVPPTRGCSSKAWDFAWDLGVPHLQINHDKAVPRFLGLYPKFSWSHFEVPMDMEWEMAAMAVGLESYA
jgi:hypothetical protein